MEGAECEKKTDLQPSSEADKKGKKEVLVPLFLLEEATLTSNYPGTVSRLCSVWVFCAFLLVRR